MSVRAAAVMWIEQGPRSSSPTVTNNEVETWCRPGAVVKMIENLSSDGIQDGIPDAIPDAIPDGMGDNYNYNNTYNGNSNSSGNPPRGRPTMDLTEQVNGHAAEVIPAPPDPGKNLQTAGRLVREHVSREHPERSRRDLTKNIAALMDQGMSESLADETIKLWCTKRVGTGQTILASLASEVVKSAAVPANMSAADRKALGWQGGSQLGVNKVARRNREPRRDCTGVQT